MTAKRSSSGRRLPLVSCLLLGLIASSLQVANAATFVVNALEDVGDATPGDGVCASALFGGTCTLRAAVQESNALAGADTIQIPSFPITLVFTGSDDAALVGDLDLTDDVNIEGTGLTLLDRGTAERVFEVVSGNASISGLRFSSRGIRVKPGARGSLRDSEFRDFAETAIENSGALDLMDVEFEYVQLGVSNAGTLRGRRLRILGSIDFPSIVFRTAIINSGNLILSDSLIEQMTPFLGSAAVLNAGRLLMTNVAMTYNSNIADSSAGATTCAGALYNRSGAVARLIHTTFAWNQVVSSTPSPACRSFNGTITAPDGGPLDIYNEPGGSVEIGSSIVYSTYPLTNPNCAGDAPVSLGYNTGVSSSICGFTAPGTDLTGGVTFAYAPDRYAEPSGANAIGSGPVGCPPRDARGHSRPNDVACDRGAVQVGGDFACQNGLDDDGDGLVDLLDPGCTSATDPLEVDLSPGDILLTSVDRGMLFSVDPVSGRREIIAGGGGIAGPAGVVQAADGSIYTASFGIAGDPAGPLMRVDPETGEQTVVAWDDTALNNMTGMVELANGHLAVASPASNQIAEVDPTTGLVTTLATGPGDFDPNGIALDPTTGDLFATTPSGSDRLFEIVGGVAVPIAPASTAVGTPRDLEVAGDFAYISDSGIPRPVAPGRSRDRCRIAGGAAPDRTARRGHRGRRLGARRRPHRRTRSCASTPTPARRKKSSRRARRSTTPTSWTSSPAPCRASGRAMRTRRASKPRSAPGPRSSTSRACRSTAVATRASRTATTSGRSPGHRSRCRPTSTCSARRRRTGRCT